ncbi:Ni,Fe-hydrogenase I large subunit [Thermanaerosceptrum fracticalcis]|uniref:Ni,Fe-hydrogenase I large subunit n=1 Tax=Thermanaerosceptrum fracticalcis TaxID=1712410 RepID=A0A7G6E3X6_THEFR|nr:nickel-dependent hydrogenase large subunit [Thermanaerosceptrum fracticalcis]QNB46780.1 Ni,Fe-hydrogenase I large subunit [Thermanaerosceptrum fracticalcis]
MSKKVITIDPVTRVEGHLKIKVELDKDNKVASANVTGNLYRDMENILKNRHPWDAIHITQRICGVCPVSHAIASVKANEQAMGFTPSEQAILRRTVIQSSNYMQDHILHFYHLNLMDYIVGPQMNPWTPGYSVDMRLSSTETERLINNYVEALQVRRQAQEMAAILAGRVPHVMSIAPGGVTMAPDADQISRMKDYLATVTSFINNKYLSDVELLARVYSDYFDIGKGPGNLLSYGVFDQPDGSTLFKQGIIKEGTSGSVDLDKIKEYVGYSYYSSPSGLNPAQGQTIPQYGKKDAYTWLKAPRYEGEVYEVGPLARMKINGDYAGGVSVMDRIKARALETKKIAEALKGWLNELAPGVNAYEKITTPPDAGMGIGLTDAPRGALGHWLTITAKKVTTYQVITPTCWNASPKDDSGIGGAMEQALIGTTVADPDQPVELLRIVHSFDPCTGCAVHVINPEKGVDKEFVIGYPNAVGVNG